MPDFAPRLLHTMLRVRDLAQMLDFYCGTLGMRELRRIEFPAERYTLVFAGFAGDPAEAQVEFWHDWDREQPYGTRNSGYGHLGIGVRDIVGCIAVLRAKGVRILREPGPMRQGGRVIALIEDPEGYEIELLATE